MRKPKLKNIFAHLEHWTNIFKRMLRIRLGKIAVGIVLLFLLAGLLANVISPYDPAEQQYTSIFQSPSIKHWMGTDQYGRDVMSRVIYGSRISIVVGFISVGLALSIGSIVGLIAGYYSGWLDEVLMRIMDALYSFPALLLALTITAVLGTGIKNVIVAIGIVYSPIFARLVRAQTLSVKEMEYITACKAIGASTLSIMKKHIWPNISSAIIVQVSLSIGFAIIVEASLSFLGVGIQPPTPSWGVMLKNGMSYMERAPWIAFFPGIMISLTVLGMNFLGDALRDALDPQKQIF